VRYRTQSEKLAVFAEELRKKFQLPVQSLDERLTSAQANRVLRDSELSIKRRGEVWIAWRGIDIAIVDGSEKTVVRSQRSAVGTRQFGTRHSAIGVRTSVGQFATRAKVAPFPR